jgi:unsaturated rhamnogalacturonyl hydrolase
MTRALTGALLALLALGSARGQEPSLRLAVGNELGRPRLGETVEVRATTLAGRFQPADLPRLSVIDTRTGHEVLAQAVDEDGDGTFDLLLFQTDLAPGETKEFELTRGERRHPRREDFQVYGRFVREREDDFAWENDRVVFRMYGPALETSKNEPLTSSAVDTWSKRTRRLVLNDWYLVGDYHRDHGEGGDFYSAGRSRGCGGSGLWTEDGLAVSRNFRASRVLASGPIRLVFELVYPEWQTPGLDVAEVKRVTLDAGKNLNRFESFYTTGSPGPVVWAAGIRKVDRSTYRVDRERGILRTWQPQGRDGNGGWLGCGVVMDPGQIVEVAESDGNHLLVARTPDGQPATWHAGSGWDRSGDFPDVAAWDRYLLDFTERLASPLRAEVSSR